MLVRKFKILQSEVGIFKKFITMSTGDDLNGFCNSLLNFYPVRTSIPGIGPTNGTGIVMIVLGFLYLFNSALIVYFIKVIERICQ